MNMEDEVVRGACVLENGIWRWPPPPPKSMPAPAPAAAAVVVRFAIGDGGEMLLQEKKEELPRDYKKETMTSALTYASGLGAISLLGFGSPGPAFSQMMTTFGLAGIVGANTNVHYLTLTHKRTLRLSHRVGCDAGTALTAHVCDERHLGYYCRGRLLSDGRWPVSVGQGRNACCISCLHLVHQHRRWLLDHATHARHVQATK